MGKRNSSKPTKKRKTIGLLIDWLGGRYQSLLWPAIVDAAEEKDTNLIIFAGGPLRTRHGYLAQSNALYQFINHKNLDGVILASGSLGEYVTIEEFRAFYKSFHPLPIVSLALGLDNIPSVQVDNESGIHEIVNHLIKAHDHRQIAFVRGPEVNEEAELRYQAYQKALKEHNIPFNPDLVVRGNFSKAAGINAVRQFLDERQVKPQAIIAADDDSALGVLEELQRRGIQVPNEIAVTGFDDIDEAKFSTPPLTTIKQPIYDQARQAVLMMLNLLDGQPIPSRVRLPTQIVLRRSCGCLTQSVQLAGFHPNLVDQDYQIESPEAKQEALQKLVVQAIQRTLPTSKWQQNAATWAAQIIDLFFTDLAAEEPKLFLQTLDAILLQTHQLQGNISLWQEVISALRQGVLQYFPKKTSTHRAEDLWNQARVVVGEAMQRTQAFQMLLSMRRSVVENEVGRSLLSTLEFEDLIEIAAQTLPNLGIPSGYVALYDKLPMGGQQAELILVFNENGITPLSENQRNYPLVDMVPSELLPQWRRYTLVVEALYFQNQPLGFALLEMGPRDGGLYADLRRQFSSALKGALLLQERRLAETDLQQINQELESFSYSISHDLRTPLRAIRSYSDILRNDFGHQLDPTAQEFLEKIVHASMEMNDKIEALLAFARLSRGDIHRGQLNLSTMAEDVLETLQRCDPERKVGVMIQPDLVASGDAALIRIVLENLLGNAWKYSSKRTDAYIEFGCLEKSVPITYFIRDNGAGFNMAYAKNLFGAFQRLHRQDEYPGHGIGLATVQRIIQRHGGTIWAQAQEDQGATFFFTLDS